MTTYETETENPKIEQAKAAIFLKVKIGKLGLSRKLAMDCIEVNADKEWLGASKRILKCPEYDAISTLCTECKKYLKNKCLPSPFLSSAIYRVPLAMVSEVDQRIEDYRQKLAGLTARFAEVYEARVAEAKDSLKAVYDLADYPDVATVKAQFYIESQYVQWGTPAGLESVKKEIFERERDKSQRLWQEATEEVRQYLRAAFQELIAHMADRLQPGKDGKKKTFKENSISSLKDFLADFNAKDVTDDAELSALVERTREAMLGMTAKDLRKEESLRDAAAAKLGEIKTALDGMVIEKPGRKIDLDD